MSKVQMVTGWKMIQEQVKRGYSDLRWPDGNVVRMPINAITSRMLDDIDEQLKAEEPEIPQISVREPGKPPKFVDNPNDSDYKEKLTKHNKKRSLKIILVSLPDDIRPKGTEAEQLAKIEDDLLIGHITQLVKDIMAISGLNLDEAVAEAKND